MNKATVALTIINSIVLALTFLLTIGLFVRLESTINFFNTRLQSTNEQVSELRMQTAEDELNRILGK